jgi:hypothetical protein
MLTFLTTRRTVKLLHAASTAWFLLAAAYLIALYMRQAGVQWWVIFSLSGYSAAVAFLLINAYLFVIFRGDRVNGGGEVEHPLTCSRQYMLLYSLIPFMGGIAGLLATLPVTRFEMTAVAIAMGSLCSAFVLWIIIDPLIGLVEMLMPQSRLHRKTRIEAARGEKERIQLAREQLLADITRQEDKNVLAWNRLFENDADLLAQSVRHGQRPARHIRMKVLEIGLKAWRHGGLECMQHLQKMVIDRLPVALRNRADQCLSASWDGIGAWRHFSSLSSALHQ